MLHGKKFVATVAYDLYLELAEGKVEPDWKLERPVGFHRFREKLGLQKLRYSPANNKYPGDDKLRASTQLSKKRRHVLMSPSRSVSSGASGVSAELLADEGNNGRLCGFLGQLNEHIEAVQSLPLNRKRDCFVCGEKAYQICSICQAPLHYTNPPKNNLITIPCFFHYHDTGFCGLARRDSTKLQSPIPQTKWEMKKKASVVTHRKAIKELKKTLISSNNNALRQPCGGNSNSEWNDNCV